MTPVLFSRTLVLFSRSGRRRRYPSGASGGGDLGTISTRGTHGGAGSVPVRRAARHGVLRLVSFVGKRALGAISTRGTCGGAGSVPVRRAVRHCVLRLVSCGRTPPRGTSRENGMKLKRYLKIPNCVCWALPFTGTDVGVATSAVNDILASGVPEAGRSRMNFKSCFSRHALSNLRSAKRQRH